MRNLLIAAICGAFLMGCNFGSDGRQSITVKKTDDEYDFRASYPEKKTKMVIDYIEGALADDQLFADETDRKNSNISLADSTKFYLKAAPGLIEISFKKQENSFTSYQKMEELCIGIRKALADE